MWAGYRVNIDISEGVLDVDYVSLEMKSATLWQVALPQKGLTWVPLFLV